MLLIILNLNLVMVIYKCLPVQLHVPELNPISMVLVPRMMLNCHQAVLLVKLLVYDALVSLFRVILLNKCICMYNI